MSFSQRLKGLRKDHNMLQKDICKELNISLTGYAGYEQGTVKPSFDVLVKISELFDVSIDYLVGKTDIKHTQAEADFAKELETTDIRSLMEKYDLMLDNHKLTPEEKKMAIKLLKTIIEED